jgi:hypothetical protein
MSFTVIIDISPLLTPENQIFMCHSASEGVLQRELDNARIRSGRRNPAERRARYRMDCRWIAISYAGIWVGKLGSVRKIKKFSPETEAACSFDRKEPLYRQVKIVLSGPANNTDSAVAKILIGETGPVRRFRGASEGV